MTNSAYPDHLASLEARSQLIWIYTVYTGRLNPDSAGLGLSGGREPLLLLHYSTVFSFTHGIIEHIGKSVPGVRIHGVNSPVNYIRVL